MFTRILRALFTQANTRAWRPAGKGLPCSSWSVGALYVALSLAAFVAQAQGTSPPIGSPGLSADYYRGYFYEAPSFFTATTPAVYHRPIEQLHFEEAETDNFGVGSVATYYSAGKPDEFSARFQGQLYIATAGEYTFYLGSDDAASLWLDNGSLPVASNKGDAFAFREKAGTCRLTAGLHLLRVDYGEHGGSQGLVLQYSGPDMPKQLVPNGVLYNQISGAIKPTLTHFDVLAANQQVNLSWQTSAEENCVAFVVQKSVDGVVFTDWQRQAGGGTTSGPRSYATIDQQPTNGWSFYRLQQLRSDRPPVYSPLKAVEIKSVPFAVTIYPVPNDGTFFVQIQPSNVGPALLELVDMSGRLVYKRIIGPLHGAPQKLVLKPEMATGLYRLHLTSEAGNFDQKIAIGI
jgi:hypothetical protein